MYLQRYAVYLNNGTPKKEGRWVQFTDLLNETKKYTKLLREAGKISDDWEKLANDTIDELKHSYKVNKYLSFLCFALGFIIYYKEDILTLYHGLSL